jgi:hypothetical protein
MHPDDLDIIKLEEIRRDIDVTVTVTFLNCNNSNGCSKYCRWLKKISVDKSLFCNLFDRELEGALRCKECIELAGR